MPRELALVGGGHAHVEVIRSFGARPLPNTRLTVFDPNPRPIYSGMVPGFVAGQYERRELEIDLPALCARANAEFVPSAVTRIDSRSNTLHFEGGSRTYDAASLDVGATVAGADLPGVREHALASRPMVDFVARVDALVRDDGPGSDPERTTARAGSPPLRIVGGGAGGVELALCLEARARRQGARARVALVTSDESVLTTSPRAVRKRASRILARRGIEVVVRASVTAVRRGAIDLEGRPPLPSSGTLWVTGPASHALARGSRLPVDSGGFVRIEPTFRVEGEPSLFAVGDCASLRGMKKAGVYAVRSGPLLAANLRAHLSGDALRRYTPQHDFLSLLNEGDGTALAAKWGVAVEGRAMMWLKDRIDRSFVAKYR